MSSTKQIYNHETERYIAFTQTLNIILKDFTIPMKPEVRRQRSFQPHDLVSSFRNPDFSFFTARYRTNLMPEVA